MNLSAVGTTYLIFGRQAPRHPETYPSKADPDSDKIAHHFHSSASDSFLNLLAPNPLFRIFCQMKHRHQNNLCFVFI